MTSEEAPEVLFKELTLEDDEPEVQEIESLCLKCYGNVCINIAEY